MANILNKLHKRLKLIKSAYIEDKSFSKDLAHYRLGLSVCSLFRFRKLASKYRNKYEMYLINYFDVKLQPLVDKYEDDTFLGEYEKNAPIWVCWWTGEDSAPALVKQCINSIMKNAGNHPVHIITDKNYTEFIEIPKYMLRKADDGKMKLAHLADYIRVSLLEKYGGLWLDATIYCSQKIKEEYFSQPFFTCKSDWQECGYISHMQWVTFVLGGWKGNIVYRFLKDVFELYWKEENAAIDYLMFDYMINFGNKHIPQINRCIEQNSNNNLNRDDLQAAFNNRLPAEYFDSIIKEDTVLYKLSWRETYSTVTADGCKSIYTYFLDMDI